MSKTKILIVDDNPHIVKLISMHLQSVYDLAIAEDGEAGLAMAFEVMPDLIITDVSMPKMDGIQMCLRIRENPNIAMTPFIFLTSFDADVTRKKGFRQGADQYLIKSEIQPETLLSKVQDMLRRVDKIRDFEQTRGDFKGELSDLSFIEAIHLLNRLKKTGSLEILRPNYPQGKIQFSDGEVISAILDKDSGLKALQTLSGWKRGSFEFHSGEATGPEKGLGILTHELVLGSFKV